MITIEGVENDQNFQNFEGLEKTHAVDLRGALGCEFLKNFALCGICCGPNGLLTVAALAARLAMAASAPERAAKRRLAREALAASFTIFFVEVCSDSIEIGAILSAYSSAAS